MTETDDKYEEILRALESTSKDFDVSSVERTRKLSFEDWDDVLSMDDLLRMKAEDDGKIKGQKFVNKTYESDGYEFPYNDDEDLDDEDQEIIKHMKDESKASEDYDENGYGSDGYDRDGYNRDGYNKRGYYKDGYNDDGYDNYGYDKDGYDSIGYDSNGRDKDGYNISMGAGFDRDGNRRGESYTKEATPYPDPVCNVCDRVIFNSYGDDDFETISSHIVKHYNSVHPKSLDVLMNQLTQQQKLHFGFSKSNEDYDRDGYDRDGYDRDGYNKRG